MCPKTPPVRAVMQCLAISIFFSVACPRNASAQQIRGLQLPPAATTGGAQPFFPQTSIPSLAQQDALEIPPLVERPLGLEEGPRLNVRQFQLDGAVDRPEYAISLTDLQDMLSLHLAAQPPAGYTVNQLQAITDDITLYYRGQGLILAQAFVPAQDVQNGVVTLQVVEGSLGAVEVEGNDMYASDIVANPFEQLLGQPVEEQAIQQALLALQNYPGLTVFGTFREGGDLGDTELLIRVQDEKRVSVTPSFDNYGSAFTGETRGRVQFEVNNPFGSADQFSGYLLQTFSPQNGFYGGFSYLNTLAGGKSAVGFGFSNNQFDVTDVNTNVDLGVEGNVQQASLFFRQGFANSRTFRADGILDLSRKDAVTTQPGDDPTDELLVLSYTYDYSAVSRQRRGINLGYVTLLAGNNSGDFPSRQGGSQALAEGSYGKFAFGYQRLQRFGQNHALLLRLDGQYSDDLLVSLEQYPIGGPANVRAYPVAEALVDSGGSATLEWIIDAPGFANRPVGTEGQTWGDVVQLSFYVDYAGGEINDPLPFQEETVNLSGYGLGLQFGYAEKFYFRLDVATPNGDLMASNDRDPQYYVSFRYTF